MAEPAEQQWIIGYDIGHSRLRQQACRALRSFSAGYQKSVFEVVSCQSDVEALAIWLSTTMEPDSDRLFIALRCRTGVPTHLGQGANAPRQNGFFLFI